LFDASATSASPPSLARRYASLFYVISPSWVHHSFDSYISGLREVPIYRRYGLKGIAPHNEKLHNIYPSSYTEIGLSMGGDDKAIQNFVE
jgi:hypothetical protein